MDSISFKRNLSSLWSKCRHVKYRNVSLFISSLAVSTRAFLLNLQNCISYFAQWFQIHSNETFFASWIFQFDSFGRTDQYDQNDQNDQNDQKRQKIIKNWINDESDENDKKMPKTTKMTKLAKSNQMA